MKIVECHKGYGESINFIDEHDVFVGYDLYQDCCEHASWYIDCAREFDYDWMGTPKEGVTDGIRIDGYVFDTSFLGGVPEDDDRLDAGQYVTFKLHCSGKPDIYLFLFNSHNGWYGHGFKYGIGSETLIDLGL